MEVFFMKAQEERKHKAFVYGYIYGYLQTTIESSNAHCVDLSSTANLTQATICPMNVIGQAMLKMNAARIKTDSTRLADLFAEIDDAGMRLSLEEQGEFMRGLYAGRKPKLEKLALLRQEKGLSQKALAEKVEISLSTLRKYEIGERNLRFAKAEVVQKIAVVLGCRMEDLL